MGTLELVIAIVVALVVVAILLIAAWAFSRRRRTERLHRRFGPEYEHAVTTKTKSQEVTTEDLRQAMTYYREIFNELLGTKVQERV